MPPKNFSVNIEKKSQTTIFECLTLHHNTLIFASPLFSYNPFSIAVDHLRRGEGGGFSSELRPRSDTSAPRTDFYRDDAEWPTAVGGCQGRV